MVRCVCIFIFHSFFWERGARSRFSFFFFSWFERGREDPAGPGRKGKFWRALEWRSEGVWEGRSGLVDEAIGSKGVRFEGDVKI